MPRDGRPDVDRFVDRVNKTDACWLWAAIPADEYGVFSMGRPRRQTGAHRASYLLHVGPIPKGMLVRHKCDTPACVRPDHLELGTHRENALDHYARHTIPRAWAGGMPPKARHEAWFDAAALPDEPAVRLAVALARRDITKQGLARRLGVPIEAISRFLARGLTTGGKVTWERIAEALRVPVACFAVGGPWLPLVE